ncbi:Gustatory receptor for sugar taste 64e [Frankliniella fusca]|uniref:Gustatory receptor for sugar taste 64e n=1 Tax=Frankliniella fusca TaxID=407009 RepID=A0AAE1H830_9NEOP|nr:Gustatory receptor for sugar taste 64e [Frankliniella fusca]
MPRRMAVVLRGAAVSRGGAPRRRRQSRWCSAAPPSVAVVLRGAAVSRGGAPRRRRQSRWCSAAPPSVAVVLRGAAVSRGGAPRRRRQSRWCSAAPPSVAVVLRGAAVSRGGAPRRRRQSRWCSAAPPSVAVVLRGAAVSRGGAPRRRRQSRWCSAAPPSVAVVLRGAAVSRGPQLPRWNASPPMKKHPAPLWIDSYGSPGLPGPGPPGVPPASRDRSLLTSDAHPDSFAAGVRLAVRAAQCFSLFPIRLAPGREPRFRWMSLRIGYALLVLIALFIRTYSVAAQGKRFVDIAEDLASTSFVIIITLSFFMLAWRWRQFSLLFLRIENASEQAVGDAHPPGVARRMRMVTLVLFFFGLAEHCFDKISEATDLVEDYNYTSTQDFLNGVLFERPFWEVAFAVFVQLTWSYVAFIVTFNDLFTMLVAVYIARRIANFNSHLAPSVTKDKSKYFWENARKSYDALATFTKEVDGFISRNILITFTRNLLYICLQLLYFLRNADQNSPLRSFYHFGTFSYVLMRTFFVAFFAASVNDQSKLSKTFLYSVTEQSYCHEVQRFLEQAANDEISLTGYNFFRVTRSFILTVGGTMATYEVILLQINKT